MSKSKPAFLPENPESTVSLVKRLVKSYLRDRLGLLALAILCMVMAGATTAAFTQIVKPIIDDIFVDRDNAMLWPVALASLIVFMARGLASYGEAVLMSRIGLGIVAQVQRQLYACLVKQDLAFFDNTPPGRLVARFIADANRLNNALAVTLTGVGKDLFTVVALTAVMFYEDWLLAVIAFVSFPLAVFPIVRIGRRLRKVSKNAQIQTGSLATVLDESFQGVRYVKAYSMEAYETKRAVAAIMELYRTALKAARTRAALNPIMEVLGGLAVLSIVLYGGQQVMDGTKTPGSFFAFVFALMLAYEPVKHLARLNATLQEGLAAAVRIFEVIDSEPKLKNAPGAKPLVLSGPKVELKDVAFSYTGRGRALDRVSLEVPAGKRVALVGASGSGKTTVLNLVPRFYDVEEGAVLIDGQDVRDLTLESLRGAIALVSQETLLFDDSIRNNIAYGRPEVTQEAVERAAADAGAAEFIERLPNRYDTLVGPRGAKLSGGQRQRIAIARALLKDAPILLLDEATSALDTKSERHVQRALDGLMKGRTSIVIAHRLSTIVDADLIYVMDRGRIVEAGSHNELLARNGAYARLHALQYAKLEDKRDAEADALVTK